MSVCHLASTAKHTFIHTARAAWGGGTLRLGWVLHLILATAGGGRKDGRLQGRPHWAFLLRGSAPCGLQVELWRPLADGTGTAAVVEGRLTVSQICSLICLPSIVIILAPNSTPASRDTHQAPPSGSDCSRNIPQRGILKGFFIKEK